MTNLPLVVGQLVWLVKKGDAILSNEPRRIYQMFVVRLTESDSKTGSVPIYTFPDEDTPTTFEDGMEFKHAKLRTSRLTF